MKGKKKIFTDLIWSVLALGVMHGVLQILVYPYLNRRVGADQFGNILYVLAILGVIAPSIGLSANNTRLIQRQTMEVESGDYLLAMLPQTVVGTAVFVVLAKSYVSGALDLILAALALVFTVLRNYGEVEYRMSLNYKGYFIYYLTLSAGYLCGALMFPLTGSWILSFLLGEVLATILGAVKGYVYWPFVWSTYKKTATKACLVLSGSYLFSNTVIYLDRLLLQNFMDGTAVSVYYVASLFGKTAALLVGPLNGVLIGYLTKGNSRISKSQFVKAFGGALGLGALLYGAILVATPVFARLFYPEIADMVMEIAWLANLSQVLCFLVSPLLTVMLTFCNAKWQLAIESCYAVGFILASLLGFRMAGFHGFIIGGLLSNAVRVAAVFFHWTDAIEKNGRAKRVIAIRTHLAKRNVWTTTEFHR